MAEQPGSGGGEKTEKPTAKRLTDAAKNGDILQSKELATAMVVMAGMVWIAMAGPTMMQALRDMLVQGLQVGPGDLSAFEPGRRTFALLTVLLIPIGGILAITFAASIAAPALLGSLGFRASAMKPKASKINPASGLKRMFGMQGLMELLKSIAKVGVLGLIGGWLVWDQLATIGQMGKTGVEPAMAQIGQMFVLVCLALAGGLFLIAGIDVPAQIFQRNKRLYMTKQEVRDEHKESEGSPEVKGAIRRRQYEMMNGSIKKAVEDSSIVLTNPTHFAVALRYRPGLDMAPIVLARGSDEIARAIREAANAQSVPVLQYPELTRAIYYTSRVGHLIDDRLYLAVATILAFVFRIENRMATEMDRPHIDLPDALRFDADGKNIVN